jgi:hypothetical protein
MKNKIKPFIKRLIKENIAYIFGNFFIIFLIIITIKMGLSEIHSYNQKIDSLKLENKDLMNKLTLINSVIPASEKLDEDVKILNMLIPNAEDYFSIIYALDKLSTQTNFVINSYTINIGASTQDKLKISVEGVGDSQSLINFLKNYNFSGGRLITSDKVQIDPNFSGSIKIDLTFYNKKTAFSDKLETPVNNATYKELEDIKGKVHFNLIENDNIATGTSVVNYPKKSNPF